MPTRTFTVAELKELGIPDKWRMAAGMELHREQVNTRRWVSVHQLVFRAPDDGRAYAVTYENGLTENQSDTPPFGWGETEVVATEMVAREVTVTRWEPTDGAPETAQ